MPHAFHRALRQRNAASRVGSDGVAQLDAAERAAMETELLHTIPSLACPECPSYPRTEDYRKVPFTVAVSATPAGAGADKMFASMKPGDSRLRFLTKPNAVIFGPLLTTTRANMALCDGDGPYGPLATQSDDILCQTTADALDESRAPFGVDPAFVQV